MKNVFFSLSLLLLVGGGCLSSSNAPDLAEVDEDIAANQEQLDPEVKQIKDNFELLEIAAQTDHCDTILLNIAPSAGATEDDCDAILAFAKANPLVSVVDWSATTLDGETGQLYREDGSLMMNLEYDDSGSVWGYKIADRFWDR